MCVTCGCSETDGVVYTDAQSGEQITVPRTGADTHVHPHKHDSDEHHHQYSFAPTHEHHFHTHPGPPHGYGHPHDHEHTASGVVALHARAQGTTIALEQDILAKNQLLAERNRGWLAGREILALNLVSSPGSGKTTLLERTIRDLQSQLAISVIEGDQATMNDAERIRATGCKVIQINTGTGCHLEADMLARGLQQLNPPLGSVVMIENVGNLVCPALFDLGEQAKVVILSVTEGEDKPIKYPHMFKASSVMLLNKIDLLPYLKFDVERCIAYARQVNPAIEVFRVSAETGEGMSAWYDWLRSHSASRQNVRATP
ncbi:MAG TPA: hydrogenase nickel incorporation protein HypB [Gammaproteobacteria bacterium]|nr:hydrogenase nickel incorporation protein HypB [Gammaproteobacteria bacterium]